MKQLLFLCAGAACALLFASLSSSRAPAPVPELPGGIRAGSVVYGFSVLKGGAGGLSGIDASTPVTVRELKDGWILVDYPSRSGGPSWVNGSLVVSYQISR